MNMEHVMVQPIVEIGKNRTGTLHASWQEILKKCGPPNVTHLDDPAKVKASWAFQHEDGRKAFIWCYKESRPRYCTTWSTDGSKELLKELFGNESVK